MKRSLLQIGASEGSYRMLHIAATPGAFSCFENLNANAYILSKTRTDAAQHVARDPKRVQTLSPRADACAEPVSGPNGQNLTAQEQNSQIPTGYWSQPELSVLKSMSLQELKHVANFSIGKSAFGKIIFQFPVDLSQFASNWDNLWESVSFSRNLVNVNHINGQGLNVPAVIYLENVRPAENQSLDDFIIQLKSPLGMEFISYDPHSQVWAFKVDHFSVWGLVNDSSDPKLVSQFNKQQQNERLRISLSFNETTPNTPLAPSIEHIPGFLPHSVMETIQDDSMRDETSSINEEDVMEVTEKTVEPALHDIMKHEQVSQNPHADLQTDSDWDRQLALANSNFSIFNANLSNSPGLSSLHPSAVNDLLFKDSYIPQKPPAVEKSPFPDAALYAGIFNFYSSSNTLTSIRSNSFPRASLDRNTANLSIQRASFTGPLGKLWDLASILYDSSYAPTKREAMCKFIQEELDLSVAVNEPLDAIVSAICKGNMDTAIELSVESNNFHLATLLTSIGQSQEAAKLQLSAWENDNALQHVPSQIVWIYKLLKGDFNLSDNWAITIFLGLKYTTAAFDDVLASIKSKSSDDTNQFYKLVSAYVSGQCDNFDIPTLFLLSSACGITVPNLDSTIIKLKEMLVDNGYVEESLYVLSFLENDATAKEEITNIVESHVSELKLIDNDTQLHHLTSKYHIPPGLLYVARGKDLASKERFYDSAWQYIKGAEITTAYDICLDHIAPQYVIGGNAEDLSKLKELLLQFTDVTNWSKGGKVYVDYIDKSPSLKDELPFLETKTWHQRIAKTIMLKLLEHL